MEQPDKAVQHSVAVSSRQLYGRREFLKGLGVAGAGAAFASNLLIGEAIARPEQGGPAQAQPTETGWQPKDPPLSTPWTAEVSPENALLEYPRPQMVREKWLSLNGVWQFAAAVEGEQAPIGRDLSERVLVPYPVESALSGIMRQEQRMWYRRRFEVPRSWRVGGPGRGYGGNRQRLLLHFEAVDYEATVWVNGERIGEHRGGYDSFTFDITDALNERGEQEILVGVYDPTDAGGQPVGKQVNEPGGIFYTPSSGIWQTVWMEPVPEAHIERLDMTPDLSEDSLWINVRAADVVGETVEVVAYDGKREAGRITGPVSEEIRLPLQNPRLWSPEDPFLYDLEVRLIDRPGARPTGTPGKGGRPVDKVESYFGMRLVGRETVNGVPRLTLNGEPVFNFGTLDQGFWPDGIHTAPTDEALRFDLEEQKRLGYNTVRKHIKVEPKRWFYHADRLGLIVWQDMPSMPSDQEPSAADRRRFEEELRRMIEQHHSQTSICMWVPFNEDWGAYDEARITELVERLDPSRLVDNHSGFNVAGEDGGNGDVVDFHNYVGPGPVPDSTNGRAAVVGEYGGLGLRVEGHEWQPGQGSSYETQPDAAALTDRYVELAEEALDLVSERGLAAAIYTQPTDVENEINGLYTYDRKVLKPDPAQLRRVNETLSQASADTSERPARR